MIKWRRWKPKRISIKLGILILLLFTVITFIADAFFYRVFIDFYVEQQTEELLHRGHSHATVLGNHFNDQTLRHVEAMEQEAITSVVVLNRAGEVIAQSEPVEKIRETYLQQIRQQAVSPDDSVLENDWRTKPYLVTRSAIVQDDQVTGTVVMFSPTRGIREAAHHLQWIIMIVAIGAVLISAVLIFLLSRMVTNPLIKLKKATEQIARGDYNLKLSEKGEDEVADLARSINSLAHSLHHYESTRNEFLADISHELRTPLTYIKGYSEVLSKGMVKDEEEKTQYLQFIHEEAARMQKMVKDLMDLSRLEEGSFFLNKVEADLVDLVSHTVKKVKPAMDEAGLELAFHSKIDQLYGNVDPERLQQVLFNLLDNAREHTPSGGEIQVTVSLENEKFFITVSDTGKGIPADQLPFIWQRLYRVEKSRSRKYGGTGLGLTIVKKIVELHSGEIKVSSQEGKGTSFVISLPIGHHQTGYSPI